MTLRRLTIEDKFQFDAISGIPLQNDVPFALFYQPKMKFEAYLELLQDFENGSRIPEGSVATSIFYAFLDGKIVGRLSLRHSLNERGLNADGHMGLAIHPDYQKRGLGGQIIRASFMFARQLKIPKLLMTVDEDNIASKKLIEKLGAVYENTYTGPLAKKPVLRYWLGI
jgi:predicted acetyltransferase